MNTKRGVTLISIQNLPEKIKENISLQLTGGTFDASSLFNLSTKPLSNVLPPDTITLLNKLYKRQRNNKISHIDEQVR